MISSPPAYVITIDRHLRNKQSELATSYIRKYRAFSRTTLLCSLCKAENNKTIRFRRKKQAHTSHGLYFCNNFLTLNYYDFFFIRQILFCIFHSFSFYKIQSHHHRKSIKKGLFCLKIRLLWTSTQDLSVGTRRRLAAFFPSVELFGWHLKKTESTSIRVRTPGVLQADDRSTRTRNVLHCSESQFYVEKRSKKKLAKFFKPKENLKGKNVVFFGKWKVS